MTRGERARDIWAMGEKKKERGRRGERGGKKMKEKKRCVPSVSKRK